MMEKIKPCDRAYVPGPDSRKREGVPEGRVTVKHVPSTIVYPGTDRRVWLYVPAGYDGKTEIALMVFLDGGFFVKENFYNAPVVLDNLIAQGAIPPMAGVFVEAGSVPGVEPPKDFLQHQRSIEYDTMSGTFVRFLEEEVLPDVRREAVLSGDPEMHGICGSSSGGIASFTAAWERPDVFRKAISFVGSFEAMRGGHNYPSMIRRGEARPIRVFLQTGKKDLDWEYGNWPLANKQMAAALKFRGYDHKFVFGRGGHDHKHAAALLPDAMRWLWRK